MDKRQALTLAGALLRTLHTLQTAVRIKAEHSYRSLLFVGGELPARVLHPLLRRSPTLPPPPPPRAIPHDSEATIPATG
jgi:hypothetical protein